MDDAGFESGQGQYIYLLFEMSTAASSHT